MKKVVGVSLVVSVCFLSCFSLGKTLSEPLTYTEVVDVDDTSASDLFTKAMWFFDDPPFAFFTVAMWFFDGPRFEVQFSDRESGIIKCKYVANLRLNSENQYLVTTTITVNIKDCQYCISFTDTSYKEYNDKSEEFIGGDKPVTKQRMAEPIKNDWLVLSEQLAKKMSVPTKR
ncbi:MAG: hypothetical protein LBK69_00735 [Syntrophomonadaceae bacterium]|jgi:hypothetical protein|nr:hypothetical protein [Syntrophomonadaceae bacterium]